MGLLIDFKALSDDALDGHARSAEQELRVLEPKVAELRDRLRQIEREKTTASASILKDVSPICMADTGVTHDHPSRREE